MLAIAENTFAQKLVAAAKASGHPWPGYIAAAAFLESAAYASADGESGLAEHTDDILGLKEPSWWKGQVYDENTREVLAGVSVMEPADWPVFPTLEAAFAAGYTVLKSMPSTYGEALAAHSGDEFIRLVSASWLAGDALPASTAHPVIHFPSGSYQFKAGRWSTDPNRASSVLEVYDSHPNIFAA